jgi:heat-inducible transcriptional repressor
MLSPRAEAILNSIVQQYIASAEAVPSQRLVGSGLGVSSATIRNEMVRLERAGYITRPHPSAGGIPGDKAYRYYVESLSRTGLRLPLAEQFLISHLFHQVEDDLEEWLRLAVTITARSVHNVALATNPRPANCRFKHVGLMVLRESLVLVVLILHGAKIKEQLVTLDQAVSQEELAAVANRFNAAYSGWNGPSISAEVEELSLIERQLADCLARMMAAEDEQEYEPPYVDGLHFMLSQPEFIDSRRALSLMELIEQHSLLPVILPPGLPGYGVQIVIGKENKAEAVQDFSVVIGRYGLPEEAIGIIGIIGPTRMPYGRVISTIGFLSSLLSRLVAELYGKEMPAEGLS